jgi:hypothetical protein
MDTSQVKARAARLTVFTRSGAAEYSNATSWTFQRTGPWSGGRTEKKEKKRRDCFDGADGSCVGVWQKSQEKKAKVKKKQRAEKKKKEEEEEAEPTQRRGVSREA